MVWTRNKNLNKSLSCFCQNLPLGIPVNCRRQSIIIHDGLQHSYWNPFQYIIDDIGLFRGFSGVQTPKWIHFCCKSQKLHKNKLKLNGNPEILSPKVVCGYTLDWRYINKLRILYPETLTNFRNWNINKSCSVLLPIPLIWNTEIVLIWASIKWT